MRLPEMLAELEAERAQLVRALRGRPMTSAHASAVAHASAFANGSTR